MYDKHLDTFLAAADAGSFSKAAEQLFISPNAVIKQINLLEQDLGIPLFIRSNQGIELTEAGQSIYYDAKRIIRIAEQSVDAAKKLLQKGPSAIRFGTSMLHPCRSFLNYWISVCEDYSDLQLQIVPFDDSNDAWYQVLEHLGNTIDVIAGIYPSTLWGNRCQVLKLSDQSLCCAISRKNPLSEKHMLTYSDLHGQTLLMVERGNTRFVDDVRNDIEAHHPEIHIQNVPSYDPSVFNQCDASGGIMITIESWSDIHPSLVTVPVAWDYTVPYGIIYALQPSKAVLRFLDAVKATYRNLSEAQRK